MTSSRNGPRKVHKPSFACPNGRSTNCWRTRRNSWASTSPGIRATPYAPILEKYTLHTTATLGTVQNRGMTRIGGLISAVQQGFSKKTNKAYAMLTLEDLTGSVQVLCMNENHEKFRDLFVPNKAVLVIGEVNSSEDKPKRCTAGNHAYWRMRKFTKQVHFRLHSLKPEDHGVRPPPGGGIAACPCSPADPARWRNRVFVETHELLFGGALAVAAGADEALAKETYYAKVDTTLAA